MLLRETKQPRTIQQRAWPRAIASFPAMTINYATVNNPFSPVNILFIKTHKKICKTC
jgi:hypothetical protein